MSTIRYPTKFTNVLGDLPGALPTGNVPDDVKPTTIAAECLEFFKHLRSEHFTHDALWRDSFALTGTMRTFYSAPIITAVWDQLSAHGLLSEFRLADGSCKIAHAGSDSSWIEAQFTFKLSGRLPSYCSGFMSLVPDESGRWKIWVLRTILEQFTGYPSADTLSPRTMSATENGGSESAESASAKTHYQCIVLGGGQAGLSTAGRLKALGVDYLVVEKYANIGDNWKYRYNAAKLHGTRHTANLPFERTFSSQYPLYPGKDDLARGYQEWADRFGINIWLSTSIESGNWNSEKQQWNIKLCRNGEELWLSTDHVVLAVGGGGQVPSMPNFPGRDTYQGDVLHSADFKSSAPWRGKKGIVIGAANTGHDLAEDMLEHGLSVTMIQRGKTYVVPLEYISPFMDSLYNEDADLEISDRIQFSTPAAVTRSRSNKLIHSQVAADAERFDALERRGFRLERWGEMFRHQTERLGGHYIDVGTSAKIADGRIKVKSDAQVVSYNPRGLLFSDGTEIEADVILFATGFQGNMRQSAADIFGTDIADQLEDYWGMNSEGEILGAFKPSGHPRLWYMGGGSGHARYFSRFVALQVKAALEGKPLRIYNDTPTMPVTVPNTELFKVEVVPSKAVEDAPIDVLTEAISV